MTVVVIPLRRSRPSRYDRMSETLAHVADQLDALAAEMPGAQVNGDVFATLIAALASVAREGLR